jgi:hypothetical protein
MLQGTNWINVTAAAGGLEATLSDDNAGVFAATMTSMKAREDRGCSEGKNQAPNFRLAQESASEPKWPLSLGPGPNVVVPGTPEYNQFRQNLGHTYDWLRDRIGDYFAARSWHCDATCNVQQIDPKATCPDRVHGSATGPTEELACRAAKREATQSTPRGCYPRHCECSCTK